MPEPLLSFTIHGRAAGKKTSGSIIYPGIMGLRLRHKGKPVRGVQDLLECIKTMAPSNPAKAAATAGAASRRAFPSIVPPKSHEKWLKGALKVMDAIPCKTPIVPSGHMLRAKCVVYMAKGQRGDLINFEEALWDALTAAGLIADDHWINSHDGSKRVWTDPLNPRMEVALYDLGPQERFEPPKVSMKGLADVKRAGGSFSIEIEGEEGCGKVGPFRQAEQKSREALVMEAMRLWKIKTGRRLPDGAIIHCWKGRKP